jgi:hypothetical protein
MPKQIIFRTILVVFFTMTYIFMNAQCSISLSNPNQPLINIVTNANCQAEFNAAPYLTQVGQNCTLKYFKDQALTMPYTTAIPTFTSSNLGQQITIYVIVDDNNPVTPLPASIPFVVKIIDSVAPTLFCPAALDVVADGVACTKVISTGLAVNAIDNCGGTVAMTWELSGATLASGTGSPNGQIFATGQTIIKYKGTDISGNTGTCNATVTVSETVVPTLISCPASITLDAPTGTCERMVISGLNPSYSDNCTANPNVTFTITGSVLAAGQGSANSTIFKVGTALVKYFATDNFGNKNTGCAFNVTIKDIDKPTIICPTDVTVNTLVDTCFTTISATLLTPVRFDNCGQNNISTTYKVSGATVSNTLSLLQIGNQIFNKGLNIVTFTAADASGNTNICSMNVLVKDKTAPKLNCNSNNISQSTALGLCEKVIVLPAPTYSDNCTPLNDIVLNCEIKGTTNRTGIGIIPLNQAFKTGKSIVTYKATDLDGNSKTCSYEVFLQEAPNVRPKIVCRQDTFVIAEQGKCNKLIANGLQAKSATDNCSTIDVMTLSVSFKGATLMADTLLSPTQGANGFTFNSGATIVRYILKDASGNADTCSFNITVLDQQRPEITCTNDLTLSAGTNCERKVNNLQPIATDNCGTNNLIFSYVLNGATPNPVTVQIIDSVKFKVGVTNVKFYVRDAANNRDSCNFKVTITETVAPQIVCPNNISINTTDTTCTAFLQNILLPTLSDNCTLAAGLSLTFQSSGATDLNGNGNINGRFLNYGINSITYKTRDFSNNEAQCTFNITVKDATAPTIFCPANLTVNTSDTTCYVKVISPSPVFKDNCSTALSYIISGATLASGTGVFDKITLNAGLNTVIYKVSDLDNNVATCPFSVFVRDTIKPKIICPANVTANTGTNNCTVSLSNIDPVSTDNCSAVNLTFTSTGATTFMNEMGSASNRIFNKGINNIKYKIIDNQGNNATCNFTLTVLDITQPLISCKNKINLALDSTGNLNVNPKLFDNGTNDNCTATINLNFSLSKSKFDCTNIGDNALLLTVKDDSGNASTCPTILNVQKSANNLGFTVSASTVIDESYWGSSNGIVMLSVSGGLGTYSYQWSNGKTTQNIFDLAAGTYEVTVTDNVSKCVGKAIAKIANGPKLTLSATQTIAKTNDIISIPIRVQNFNKINGLSFSLRLNQLNIASFEKVENFGIPNLDSVAFNVQPNRITFTWKSDLSLTLPNGTAIFYIKTKIIGTMGEFSALNFEAIPMPIAAKQTLPAGIGSVPLTLQNGSVGISNGNSTAEITSNFKRENGSIVSNIKSTLSGTYKDSTTTNSLGQISFILPMGAKAIIKPYRNDNHKNGLTAIDLVLMQRHILGTQLLNSPYKKIAADVNRNGVITAADLTELRYLLLGTISIFNKNTSWRFVPSAHIFPPTGNNNVPTFPDSLSYDYLLDNQLNKDFVAIKIADLNFSATPSFNGNATTRTDKSTTFFTENNSVEAGENFEIVLKNKEKLNVEALALSFGFDAEKMAFQKLVSTDTNTFLENETNIEDAENGNLKLVNLFSKPVQWSENQSIVKVVFTAKTKIDNLQNLINVENSTIFANNEEKNILLDFREKQSAKSTFLVKNALPNPAKDWAIVPVETNEKGIMTTTIFDINGRVVQRQKDEIFRTYHEIKLDLQNLETAVYIIENQLNGYVKKQKLVVR